MPPTIFFLLFTGTVPNFGSNPSARTAFFGAPESPPADFAASGDPPVELPPQPMSDAPASPSAPMPMPRNTPRRVTDVPRIPIAIACSLHMRNATWL